VIDPVVHWHTEHVYFGQLLNLLRKQIDRFHQGEEPNYELILDIVTYLRDYSDQYHHPREDVAFERLAKACPELELVLARLQQEHRVIAHAGSMLLTHVQAVLEGTILPRADLESAAATFLVYYDNHIATEEEAVLTRAAKHLTADDWIAVRDAVPLAPDPLFGSAPLDRFRELRRQIAAEAQAAP
jgi:hemerythrin-like domain-containing protein